MLAALEAALIIATGQPDAEVVAAAADALPVTSTSNPPPPAVVAAPAATYRLPRDVTCTDHAASPNATTTTAFGVLCRFTPCSADGMPAHDGPLPPYLRPDVAETGTPCAYTVFVLNLRNDSAVVGLTGADGGAVGAVHDVLTNSSGVPLPITVGALQTRVLLLPRVAHA